MIPKSQVIKPEPMLSADEAEQQIDQGIQKNGRSFDLCPIRIETIREVVARYEAGGWNVRCDNLRMPNGYRVTLS